MKKIIFTGLLAGVLLLAICVILMPLWHYVFPNISAEYANPGLFRPWSDPLMSLYFVYPFVLALPLAWLWDKVKGAFHGSVWKRGAYFGLMLWVVMSIPGMWMSYSSFPVSFTMVLSWAIGDLINMLVAGLVFARFNK